MTITVTHATRVAIFAHSYNTFSETVGVVAIALLVVLLLVKELLRAGGERWSLGMRGADVAIFPLLCAFTTIMAARILIVVLGRG